MKASRPDLPTLLKACGQYLTSQVSKVRILGEVDARELKDVFVELSIVRQRAPELHGEFLGLMDSTMRRRFNPFANTDREILETPTPATPAKRRLKPDELLRTRVKAIVSGAPGCGKTTLLKYLALQAQASGRLVFWIELKGVEKAVYKQAQKAAARNGSLILQELWLKHLQSQLLLSSAELKLLREYSHERLKASEVVALLDGFDEIQDEPLDRSINQAIVEFTSGLLNNTLLVSTRPYAQHKLGTERLQELEIEPLGQRQIRAFLNCYYPGDSATKLLLKTLRERSSIRELLHQPLLLGVILRLQRENRFTDDRLKLYETIINDLIHELDRSKSIDGRFKINNKRLRLNFLKFLAFERLLRDHLNETEQAANRLIFSYELLVEKARAFLRQERSSHEARQLVDDALATPLIREVGVDTFAFAHLTLQEYLAASAFAAFYQQRNTRFEAIKIFCRAYHNPLIIEMEILPMMLGAVDNADHLYAEIERWPESLTSTNLRLRGRGLAYGAKITAGCSEKLISLLIEAISQDSSLARAYREIVVKSFIGVNQQTLALINSRVSSFDDFNTANALARLGSEKAIDVLISTLKSGDLDLQRIATNTLGQTGYPKVLRDLLSLLMHDNSDMRHNALDVLGEIGSETATKDVVNVLLNDPDWFVRSRAAYALSRIGSEVAIDPLIYSLRTDGPEVRRSAAYALFTFGTEAAVDALATAMNDDDWWVRWYATEGLGHIGSPEAINHLSRALKNINNDVRWRAAVALAHLGSEEGLEMLLSDVKEEDITGKAPSAAYALGWIGSDQAIAALTWAMTQQDRQLRAAAAEGLGITHSDKAVDVLLSYLTLETDNYVKLKIIEALGEAGSQKSVDTLIRELVSASGAIFYVDFNAYRLRSAMANALGRLRSERATNILIRTLKDDEFADTREQAAGALGEIGSDKAIDPLIDALRSDSLSSVRAKAAEALGKLNSDTAVGPLIHSFNADPDLGENAAKSLAQISSSKLASGLEISLEHGDTFVRRVAIGVVGYYASGRRTLERLELLAQTDSDEELRERAGIAAEKFVYKLRLLDQFVPDESSVRLRDNESRELVLVGEVFRIVGEAGHIFRPTPNSDWGIDGEIEFKNELGEASGQRVYLQLKSGDSYLRKRKRDGKEIFTIVKPRQASYWQNHAYPVLLVVRGSGGEIRWMNVTEYLQSHGGEKKQIEFQGESFTADTVSRMPSRFGR